MSMHPLLCFEVIIWIIHFISQRWIKSVPCQHLIQLFLKGEDLPLTAPIIYFYFDFAIVTMIIPPQALLDAVFDAPWDCRIQISDRSFSSLPDMPCASLSGSSALTGCTAWTWELVKKSDSVFKVKTNSFVYAHLSCFSHSQDCGSWWKHVPH